MILRALLFIHAVVTFAAGVVLIVAPDLIPSVIGIHLAPTAFVVCYFLAGAEFAIAFLSFEAARSGEGLRLAVLTIIVFHAATAALEIYALAQGADVRLWSNVALRVIVIVLFVYFGGGIKRQNRSA